MQSIKKWENGVYRWDVTEASKQMNPWLDNYGYDRYTFTEEIMYSNTRNSIDNEARASHGYPRTAWLQLALVYGVGLYTAKEQGIVKKGVYFQNFFRAHYFDWLLFFRRSAVYGIAGGFVLGTYFFGNHSVAAVRAYNKYRYYLKMPKTDPYNRDTQYFITH